MKPTTRLGWLGVALVVLSIGVFAIAELAWSAFGEIWIGDMTLFGSSGLAFLFMDASGIAGFIALVAAVVFRHERSVVGIGAAVLGFCWIAFWILFIYALGG